MDLADLDWTLAAMAAPFLAAAVAPLLVRLFGAAAAWLLAVAPAAMFVHFAGMLPAIADGEALLNGYAWAPQLGVSFSYMIDGLSLLFSLLITGIGTFIVIYSGAYLAGHPHQGRFLSFILLFMGSMLGLVLADDFLTLFVYWELTSITSFLLIGFDHARMAARRAALQALVVTGGGGLSLLAGLLLIGVATGASSMSEAIALGDGIRDHALYLPILILVLGGAFTKSAQVPFHSWLPNAMEAPTPVSAYLHSATMVKAGVYLLMRVHPFLGETAVWTVILPVFGGATLIAGALLAIRQTDLKLILAYTTVASLGLLVMLTGTSYDEAIFGAVAYLFAHSLFKGGLFMVSGAIDHESGSRDLRELGGLWRAMPITFAAAFLGALSMGGLPLTMGFFAKEMMYDGLLYAPGLGLAALVTAIVGNGLMFAAGFAVALYPFIGPQVETPKHVHEGPPGLWLGPAVLAALGIAAILAGGWTGAHLIAPTSFAITRSVPEWPVTAAIHLNLALALSLLTMALGALVWWRLAQSRASVARLLAWIGWGPDRGFDQLIGGLTWGAAAFTRRVQTGHLEGYMTFVFAVTALVLLVPMAVFAEWPRQAPVLALNFYEWVIAALAVAGLVAVLFARTRLIAIVALGVQGFSVALLFMLFGAPDLSFTQFMVETLSVVILALAMTRLSLSHADPRTGFARIRDTAIAGACGAGMTILLLSVTAVPFDSRLSDFFAANARTIAHGSNIVNVILVDFRGLDTLGEIAVVMIAGLAVLALLRVPGPWSRKAQPPPPHARARPRRKVEPVK
jgi:multicomponent Na+:H+ antiporter subunit A